MGRRFPMNGPEQQPDEGRDAEDPDLHKGDWGSHSHADYIAEREEPTKEQITHIEEVIYTWNQTT